jgi:flagellar export protein FliJ
MARRRRVNFDVLIRVRERQEQMRAQALATTRREIGAHERQRDALHQEQTRMFAEAGRESQTSLSPRRIQGYFLYERHLAREAVEKDAAIHALREVESVRRAELEEAMKRKRIVERLNERELEKRVEENRTLDQKNADEIASGRAALRGRRKS